VSRRLTAKPWFGPKRHLGWGWRVASREGAVATGLFLVLLVLAANVLNASTRVLAFIALVILFLILVRLTGGPPGGPEAPDG
jgi:hypothetical protein